MTAPSCHDKDGVPREACGLVGIIGHPRAAERAFYGLFALQHRGQESAGIAVRSSRGLNGHTGMGLACDVFTAAALATLEGDAAIGHVRYSTTGSSSLRNAQPLLVDYARGQLAVGHNGNLVNAGSLRKELEASGSIFQTTTDSEIIIQLMARPFNGSFDEVLANVMRRIQGAYSLAMLTPDALIGVRDPRGFRPLSLGSLDGAWILSSETCAFDLIGATFVRDIEPGEIVIIDSRGPRSVRIGPVAKPARCIFEYVYFARPDSSLWGRTCHTVRKQLGRQLAAEHPAKADVVVAVPDSGSSAALGFAEASGLPFEFAYIRNHYVGRTFIAPSQVDRDLKARVKLNVMPAVVKDKRVVIVDDSIIRGTTTIGRIAELKRAGAREVHMRVSCPPTRHPCFYGVDFPSPDQLIAARMSVGDIQRFLCADSLGYLSIEGLTAACGGGDGFCRACYDGVYPIPPEEPMAKECMERKPPPTAQAPPLPAGMDTKAAKRPRLKKAAVAAATPPLDHPEPEAAPAKPARRATRPAGPAGPAELF